VLIAAKIAQFRLKKGGTMTEQKQNLQVLFSSIKNYFSPKIIGEVNDVYVKLARVKG
jgi:hypothetical protein